MNIELHRSFRIVSRFLLPPVICLCLSAVQADHWTRFRGPNGLGVTDTGPLPTEFGPTKNLLWKATVPPGNSSPVLTKEHIFLTAYEDSNLLVLCLDRATGETLWRSSVVKERTERRSLMNDAATPTPVTDDRNVYAFFSDFGLLSYGPDGKERWRVRLGPFTAPHGMATSPILAGARIILAADQAEGSYIAAFDKDSGRLAWKTERPNFVGGYSTPVVYKPDSAPTQVVVSGPLELASYSVETGK
ncbi:MAG TPA: PQQ-binding-like beta-propeller repeat protein, partial [Terriglobia bacterium]|nr:PQQ-binding-like beta-propeller repeat protein [Terriglobia bacterium]